MDTQKISHYSLSTDKSKAVFDDLIIIAGGTVKAVLLPSELTTDQRIQWEEFRTDPISTPEPNFYVIEEDPLLHELKRIQGRHDIDLNKKKKEMIKKRLSWQQTGRFALTRWGRQNALACGVSLIQNTAHHLFIVGSTQIPAWAKYRLPAEVLDEWPSEAELMKKTIMRRFGKLYQEKYRRAIETSITVVKSNDTLSGMGEIFKKYPEISDHSSVALFGNDYMINRVLALSTLFANTKPKSNEDISKEWIYQSLSSFFQYALNSRELRDIMIEEQRWERSVIDDDFLMYWVGYLKPISHLPVLQNTINALKNETWLKSASNEFNKAGINFNEFTETDLRILRTERNDMFESIRQGLRRLQNS